MIRLSIIRSSTIRSSTIRSSTIRSKLLHACASIGLAATLGVSAASAQAFPGVPGRVTERFEAWAVICDTPPGATAEQCGAVQKVVSEARPDLSLTVIVFQTADRAARILRVLAPLGVFLPAGLGLNLDDEDLGRAVFARCVREGCEAQVVLDDALLAKMRAGTSATFIIFQTPEEGTGFPVDLSGLDAAFEAATADQTAAPGSDATTGIDAPVREDVEGGDTASEAAEPVAEPATTAQ